MFSKIRTTARAIVRKIKITFFPRRYLVDMLERERLQRNAALLIIQEASRWDYVTPQTITDIEMVLIRTPRLPERKSFDHSAFKTKVIDQAKGIGAMLVLAAILSIPGWLLLILPWYFSALFLLGYTVYVGFMIVGLIGRLLGKLVPQAA